MALDANVGLSDTDVMTENIHEGAEGSPFFQLPPAAPSPGPQSVPLLLNATQLRTMDPSAMSAEILRILATVQGRAAEEVTRDAAADDGSVALDSMTAVFLVATIGKAVGRHPLINLARVDRHSLHSVAGLGRLVCDAIAARPSIRVVA